MKGIVYYGNELEVVEDLNVRDIAPNEVRVEIKASGVCHSDLSVVDGTIPFPTPVVLGHEGAGIVAERGSAVDTLAIGDHVIISTLGNCGQCAPCDTGRPHMCKATFGHRPTPFEHRGEHLHNFANISSFANYTVVKAVQAVPIPKDVPFESAALIGCGVITGLGSVINRAKVSHGESVLVFGSGGVGLNAIQGARLADAYPIIAVDTNPKKEALAIEFGATHFIDASREDTTEAVRRICPDGVDYVFECAGVAALMELGLGLLDWNGTIVFVGVPPFGTDVKFRWEDLNLDKTIMGVRAGSPRPHHDFRMLVKLYQAGRLKLDELVSRCYPVDDIGQVITDMHNGDVARGVLQF